MKIFKHSFVVNSNIEKVWKFYIDIKHLEIITPKQMELEIINVTNQVLEQGTEIWLSGKIITKSKWHSKITYLKPYEYIDEMLTGPFKKWKHTHKFKKIDNNTTEVVDELEYDLPYGFIGNMFYNYANNKLQKIFEHRKMATKSTLESR